MKNEKTDQHMHKGGGMCDYEWTKIVWRNERDFKDWKGCWMRRRWNRRAEELYQQGVMEQGIVRMLKGCMKVVLAAFINEFLRIGGKKWKDWILLKRWKQRKRKRSRWNLWGNGILIEEPGCEQEGDGEKRQVLECLEVSMTKGRCRKDWKIKATNVEHCAYGRRRTASRLSSWW